jgi:GDP/UDP-N,N'-diacetylbacillosamine 2-epimerase (hydrolysing)
VSRRIAIITGTRAEYGLLKGLIGMVRDAPDCTLQLVVTGTHLSPDFGMTVDEIEAHAMPIAARVNLNLSGDCGSDVAAAMGRGMIGFADAYAQLRPDLVVLLGDRYEILAAAAAAMAMLIPIAHIHGGETSEGAIDESIRHAVTKMAQLHFVAAAPYRDRVVQMGENPDAVHLVGGLGVDAITNVPLLSRAELEESLGWQLGDRTLLVTFHPATAAGEDPVVQLDAVLAALDTQPDGTHILITLPNADAGGRALTARIEAYASTRPHVLAVPSLGQQRYFSALALVDAVVGNSSSGLAEAPTFAIGTVNIGDRQDGRLKAASVIDCETDSAAIGAAIARALSPAFRSGLSAVRNPYGDGGATARIFDVIRSTDLSGLTRKRFFDIPLAGGANG